MKKNPFFRASVIACVLLSGPGLIFAADRNEPAAAPPESAHAVPRQRTPDGAVIHGAVQPIELEEVQIVG